MLDFIYARIIWKRRSPLVNDYLVSRKYSNVLGKNFKNEAVKIIDMRFKEEYGNVLNYIAGTKSDFYLITSKREG